MRDFIHSKIEHPISDANGITIHTFQYVVNTHYGTPVKHEVLCHDGINRWIQLHPTEPRWILADKPLRPILGK